MEDTTRRGNYEEDEKQRRGGEEEGGGLGKQEKAFSDYRRSERLLTSRETFRLFGVLERSEIKKKARRIAVTGQQRRG